jgi:hypothetical protein
VIHGPTFLRPYQQSKRWGFIGPPAMSLGMGRDIDKPFSPEGA